MATSTRTPAARSCAIASAVESRTPSASATRPRRVRPCAASSRSSRRVVRSAPVGDREHPQPLGGQPLAPGSARRPPASGAPVEHDLRRALDHEPAVAQARGEPAAGGERQARAPGRRRRPPPAPSAASRRPGRPRGRRASAGSPAAAASAQQVVLVGRVPSGTSRTTRSRFSVSVPVLSKQTVSTRPSASSTRALRTTAPRRDSRRAAACCATVATSGSPSGTAATATATPALTASAQRARPTAATARRRPRRRPG